MFDPLDADTKNNIITDVEDVIAYDPRVQLDSLEVQEYEHGVQVKVSVLYIGYGLGESMDLLFDSVEGLMTGQQTVYSSNQIN